MAAGHREAARSVLDGPEHGAALGAGRSEGVCRGLPGRLAVNVIAGEAAWAVEDGQRAVDVLMYPDLGLDEVMAVSLLRY